MRVKHGILIWGLAALTVFGSTACSSYEGRSGVMRQAWQQGKFSEAEQIARAEAQAASLTDRLVWELDAAGILYGMKRHAEAEIALEKATQTLEYWDEQADILLSKETAATFTNLNALPYRGRGSDRIMLQTYRALNFLESGQTEQARVALNAAYQAQTEAVERNAKEIKAAQAAAEKESVDVAALQKSPELAAALNRNQSPLAAVAAYADYVNPFTTWLHGVYFLRAGLSGSDLERARKSLERVAQMEPGNSFVLADCEEAENPLTDKPITYVIFEYGVAPRIRESRVDTFLPVPVGRNMTIVPISIALPELSRENTGPLPPMTADNIPAQRLCDMNRVVKTDFENAYPIVLTRTLTTAFLKAAASAAANVAAMEYSRRDDSGAAAFVALGTMIGTSVLTYSSSAADVRAWQTLPEYFSLVRLPTPQSRRISVKVGWHSREVDLIPGTVNVVVVKAVGIATEPSIAQFILK